MILRAVSACTFIAVSCTLGKGREGRNSSSILWAKRKTREWGREQAKFKIVIG